MKETDEMYDYFYNVGKEAILEMGDNFKPYLSIMLQKGIKNHNESVILFGAYLSKINKDNAGYKMISKFNFEEFIDELIALE
ncbi:hypothetical protein [Bacillus sp. Brlt_9]|uniref:hypothetical protein n=1 Tax=Bacillus sp. Brlt_9 TaxID=3110916 RepID=UPI003F7CACDA